MKNKLNIICALAVMLFGATYAHADRVVGIGITAMSVDLETSVTDDIDNNGTIDTKKAYDDAADVGSIFAEVTLDNGEGAAVTLGLDYIPGDADIDKRSVSQSSVKGVNDGAASSGTNSAEGTIKDHYTIYIQPGILIGGHTMVYGTYGLSFASLEGKSVSLSSTDINEDKDLDGTRVGVGIKHMREGFFIKLDYSQTDYDEVSWLTSNSTKATADVDTDMMSLSVGKSF